MRDMILIEKIVELTSLARAIQRENSQSAKFTVPLEALPAHNERLNHRLTDFRQSRERLPNPPRWHLQDFALFGLPSRACQRRRSHQHGDVANKISRRSEEHTSELQSHS